MLTEIRLDNRIVVLVQFRLMDAKIQGIDDLFDDSVSYRIPQFQRSYAWSKKQWQPLWEDVRKIADHILKHGQENLLPHFMGAIVLQSKDDEKAFGEARRVLVVDGQQRLTTRSNSCSKPRKMRFKNI